MTTKTKKNTADPVLLFTPEEHRVLSRYFRIAPPADIKLPTVAKALERLGFPKRDRLSDRRQLHAAAAFIVLESVEKFLPQWVRIRNGEILVQGRDYRPDEMIPERRVAVVPQHLVTINWADSGPGFSWPAQYRATWVPFFERFIVTDSMDSDDMYGYTDLAIGHFGNKEAISEGSRRIVVKEWRRRYRYESQGKWEGLFDFGLIGPGEVEAWADAVWGADWDPNYAW